jgi:hypothetical protein
MFDDSSEKKVLRDLSTSAQKRNDKKRNNYVKMLHALNFRSVKINAASSPDEVCDLTLGAMEEALGFSMRALDHASFVVVDDGKLKFVRQSRFAVPLGYEIPLNGSKKGITVRAALTQKPVLVPDVTKDKDLIEAIHMFHRLGQSSLCL